MALLFVLGLAVAAIVVHLIVSRRTVHQAPPAPAPTPASLVEEPSELPDIVETIGRQTELDALEAFTDGAEPDDSSQSQRLAYAVALIGPPGIGKSALA